MATELILGLVLGAGLVVGFSPMKGVFWYIRELQARVSELEGAELAHTQDTYPNRKENT